MINSLKYVISNQYIPYKNLALEEYLLFSVGENECILYLWQNRNTVVIGRNQNAFKECKVEELENNNGYLVRRLSGGGAVYHDLGNLNFTFLLKKENYDLDKQLDVILKAAQKLSINAKKSGRNDITVDGKKFSGNAFFSSNGYNYHHGTILIDVNMQELSRYLNVSQDKLKSKGVSSVKSRVTNLKEYRKDLTIELMQEKLIEAFEEVYKCKAQKISYKELDHRKIEDLTRKFSLKEFIFGRKINSECEFSKRFSWGDIQIQLKLLGGFVSDIIIYSDAMNENLIGKVSDALKGSLFSSAEFCKRIDTLKTTDELSEKMLGDIKTLICENLK